MEVKLVSSAIRSNRISKDRFGKVHSSLLKKRAHRRISESMSGISKAMNHLIPKDQHFAKDDVNLLEFTVKYLKQTEDFQRGMGWCAEETKVFLKHHIFDRSKTTALLQEIEHRLNHISNQQSIIDTVQRHNTFDRNQMDESTTGVLLDLSMKQNRLRDETGCSYNTLTTTQSLYNSNSLKKREILDKIRKKILDKRRMNDANQKVGIVENEMMWRPWRY